MSEQYTYRCPKCGDTDKIDVCADIWVRLVQDPESGEFETDADMADNTSHEFDGNHGAICRACLYANNLDKFEVEEEDQEDKYCCIHGCCQPPNGDSEYCITHQHHETAKDAALDARRFNLGKVIPNDDGSATYVDEYEGLTFNQLAEANINQGQDGYFLLSLSELDLNETTRFGGGAEPLREVRRVK